MMSLGPLFLTLLVLPKQENTLKTKPMLSLYITSTFINRSSHYTGVFSIYEEDK